MSASESSSSCCHAAARRATFQTISFSMNASPFWPLARGNGCDAAALTISSPLFGENDLRRVASLQGCLVVLSYSDIITTAHLLCADVHHGDQNQSS